MSLLDRQWQEKRSTSLPNLKDWRAFAVEYMFGSAKLVASHCMVLAIEIDCNRQARIVEAIGSNELREPEQNDDESD